MDSEEDKVAKGIQEMDLEASDGCDDSQTEGNIFLYLHIADLVTCRSKQPKQSEAVVPERIGFLTQRRISQSMNFKIFPEKSEVDVSITYALMLPITPYLPYFTA